MSESESESSEAEAEDEEEAVAANDNEVEASPAKKTRKTSRRKSRQRSKAAEVKVNGTLIDHHDHKHSQPNTSKSHGHSHDDNIRGMFLHVLGDALGNVGVMASALIIWLTPWSFRFYFDPIISLFITLIILKSAIPLVRDTAKPLLQATPEHINVEDIREDIESLPGIRSCHHIHVWALTRSKLIATLDVQLDFDFEGSNGTARYMELAKAIKSCLHGHNIHNSTVQPEFCTDEGHRRGERRGLDRQESTSSSHTVIPYSDDPEGGAKKRAQGHAACGGGKCLLEDDCGVGGCCTPGAGSGTATPKKGAQEHGHEHGKGDGHAHGHDHQH